MTTLTIWLKKQIFPLLVASVFAIPAQAQQANDLTLEQAYRDARKNIPLIKQHDLISRTKEYTIANAAKGYLPQFSVGGQATYQSAVTSFPFKLNISGFTMPDYSKDQYKLYGQIDQTIYDGGLIHNQKEMAAASEMVQQQNIEVQLYSVYDRVNQLYFGALLIEEQLKLNDLLQKDIKSGLDKTTAQLANGTAFRSSADELKAQLMQAQQARIELSASHRAFTNMLLAFTGRQIVGALDLHHPETLPAGDCIHRPELTFYDYQKLTLNLQEQLLRDQLRPKFSFFAQGGYGRPGLNMLSNDFSWFYTGGIRLNWNLGSLYNYHDQKELIAISKAGIDVQKETFLFNTDLTRRQQQSDLDKYRELISSDQEIINLRESVKKSAEAQLNNGVLSAHDYLMRVDAEDQARQNKVLHQIQLEQATYNYQVTLGNIHI